MGMYSDEHVWKLEEDIKRLTEERDEAWHAYDIIEKHRGEAAALLATTLNSLRCEYRGKCNSTGCLYHHIKAELPRLSGGAYDENGNATEGNA